MQYIGLLDCNNFFVSCERLFRPDLRGKPVVVLSGNDGCVVARSNEVKELGIPMGIPVFQVRKELEAAGTIMFSSNFSLYRDISSRVMRVLKEEIGKVEQYSVDEAFFALEVRGETSNLGLGERLRALKQAVEKQTGVPVSIGLAKTKTIAKYAAEKEKRGTGICIMTGEVWESEKAKLELSRIWGIGVKTSQKMREHGLHTVADLQAADPARVDKLFGIEGTRKRDELHEQSRYRLGDKSGDQKSIMSTRSFRSTTTDPAVVEDALAYHVAHAAVELRDKGLRAGYMSVVVGTSRHSEWVLRGGSQEVVFDSATNDTRVLNKMAKELFRTFYEPGVPYKKAGVILGLFTNADVEQLDLFGVSAQVKDDSRVMDVLDSLNGKFGKDTLTVGRLGGSQIWSSAQDLLSPHYTTKWDNIAVIKAI